ncbi:MAG: hypothetical protein M1827_000632 [Pycnora praestabilis]|nr:MAG: hypothetical protein M1827_000632 [Pycnora praestabilis]
MSSSVELICPFCGFSDHDSHFLVLHVDALHSEVDPVLGANRPEHLPQVDLDLRSSSPDTMEPYLSEEQEEYVDCLDPECGESVLRAELPTHMDLHQAENMVMNESGDVPTEDDPLYTRQPKDYHRGPETNFSTRLSDSLRNHESISSSSPSNHNKSRTRRRYQEYESIDWKGLFMGASSSKPKLHAQRSKSTGVHRLGRSELGPHAREDQMPSWLRKQLERGPKVTVVNEITPNGLLMRVERVANQTRDVLPVLAQLCQQDDSVDEAFLCHPDVQHVFKMPREGGFCGYRNIQMMTSYIVGAQAQGHEAFDGRIPSIFRIQDLIEAAWDMGVNDAGRIETGGIKGTRKYIGTPEAQALLLSIGIGCEPNAFGDDESTSARERLLLAVEDYFTSGITEVDQKVHRTSLPPIYFQHPGHSLTIIGFERRKNGSCNLLVFDPIFKTSPSVCRLIGVRFKRGRQDDILKAFRRNDKYLRKYRAFELLNAGARFLGLEQVKHKANMSTDAMAEEAVSSPTVSPI